MSLIQDPAGGASANVVPAVTSPDFTNKNALVVAVSNPVSVSVSIPVGASTYAAQTDGTQLTRVTDGTNTATVKPASTAPLATDPALVVVISPNSVLTATNPSVGANAATAPTSSTLVGGVDGTGNIQPVGVLASTPAGTEKGIVTRNIPSGTQAVSAAALPLPTGAATSANQTTLGSQTSKINDGVNTASVKAASTAAVNADPALVVAISPNNSVAITAASLPLPTGAATASNLTTIGSQTTKINDGTSTAAVKAASIAAIATDPALVVAISPNNTVPVSAASLPLPTGAATAANLTTIGSQTTKINDGVTTAVVKPASTAAAATDPALVVAISPNNTLPVSASALPLPTGAATSANQTTVGSQTTKLNDGVNTAAVKAASIAAIATDPALVVAISPNNVIPVSAASLPLPTGAATETTLGTRLADTTFTGRINTLGQKAMAASTPVTLASDQSALAVTAAALPLPTGAATSANQITLGSQTTKLNDGANTAAVKAASTAAAATDPALVVAVSPNNTVAISAAALPLPTGAATAANLTTLGTQTTKINDGTNTAAVKAASTAPIATDPALVVAISPNSSITATNPSVGANSATAPTSSTQMGGLNGVNLVPVAIKGASTSPVVGDNSLVVTISPNSPSITASNPSVSATGAAIPAQATMMGGVNGANLVAVTIKGASTAPIATDPALVVSISPNSSLTATNPSVGATGATLPTSATLVGGISGANIIAAGVKPASTAAIATDQALVVAISPNNTVAVSAAALPLPTGAATSANQTTLGSSTTKINDGTNTAAVKAASTAPLATDPALVVSISPNSSLTATNPSVGATGATLPTSATLVGGINGANIIAAGVKPASTAAAATDQALVVAVSPNNSVAITAAALPLPTGAAAATTLTTLGSTTTKINDGTSTAAVKAASAAAIATDPALVVAISPNNTVPVSAAALPLPTGAATSANQTTLGSATTKLNDGTNTAAVKAASAAAVATDPALVVAVSPNNTVAISAASLPLPTGAAAATTLTTLGSTTTKLNDGANTATVKAASTAAATTDTALVVAVSPNNTVAISAAALPLPTGAATAANLTTLGTQTTKINDGTNTAAVKPASTAPAATDPALVVSISPNSSITTTNPSVGATGAALPTSANLIGGISGANIIAVGVKPASTAAVATDQALVVAISPNNTVPVSAATLPLPTGAATAANLTTLGTQTTKLNDGTNTAAVKAASAAAIATDPALVVAISPNNVVPVSAASLPLPTGAAAATTLTTLGSTTTKINDGINTAAVKAASVAPLGTDPALVVAISPNSSITATNPSVGATGSTLPTSATLVGGINGANIIAAGVKPASTAAAATDQALVVAVSPNNTVAISAASLPLPTGAAAATTLTTIGSTTTKINDGTNTAAVKAASTAPAATDPALVVAISPNSSITATNPSVGTNALTAPTSSTQMGGLNGANLVPVAIKGASTSPVVGDNSLVVTISPNSPAITASNPSVSATGAAIPAQATMMGGVNGANLVAVTIKGASTAPIATDPALVVAISPNSSITATNPSVGATGSTLPTSATLVGGISGANIIAAAVKPASTAAAATDQALVVAISPNNTVPVSAASLPLPTGAATSANQTTIGSSTTKLNDGTNTAAVKAASAAAVVADPALVVAISPNNSVAITAAALPLPSGAAAATTLTALGSTTTKINDGTTTVAVKAASTAAVVTDPALVVAISPNNVVPVSASALPLPTGAATSANQTTLGTQTTKINDGSNTAAVKAASTAPLATDPALVVAISPNSSITASNPSVGANAATAPTSSTQIGGVDGSGNLQSIQALATTPAGTEKGLVTRNIPSGTQTISAAALPLPTGAATSANQTTIGSSTTKLNDGTNTAAVKAASVAAIATDPALVVAISPNNTLPVSAASLPLPAGAATATNQTALGSQTSKINDGVNTAAVKAASTAAAATDPALVVAISPNNTVPISAAALPLPTGAATAANLTTLGSQTTKLNDGVNTAAVKAASTAAIATDPALVVAISPNNTVPISAAGLPLPTGASTETTLASRLADTTFTGRINTLGQKVMASSTPVTLASDQSAVPISAAALPLPTGAATAANQTTLGSATTKINDGTNTAAVKPASTAPAATDPALVVSISPNSSITTTNPSVGVTGAALPTSANLIGGINGANIIAVGVKPASTAAVATDQALVVAISPNNVVPVSASALPLPTGAATETTLGTRLADTTFTGRINTLGQKVMASSTPVTLASDQSALAITAAALPLPTGAATAANQTTLGSSTTKINDGTNTVAIKAASTAPLATDTSMVVTISPNSPAITASNPSVGANTSTAPTSSTQVGGVDGSGNLQSVQALASAPAGTEKGLVTRNIPSGTQPVSAASLPLPTGAATSANQTTLGSSTTKINDGVNTAAVKAASTAPAATDPALVVSISPNSSITTTNPSVGATGSTLPTSASLIGGISGANIIAVGVKPASTAAIATDQALVVAISPNNTVPVSATALPLPTGASTETTLGTRLADATFTARINTLGQKVMASSTPVTLASDQSALAITAAALPLPTGAATAANQTTLGSATTKINDGTNTAAVKAASTAPIATDPALVVSISPNSSITTTNPSVGATGSALPTSANLIGGISGANIIAVGVKPASTAAVATDQALVVAISPNNTVPISATALPLPTGAAAATTLTALGSTTTKINDGANTAAVKAASTAAATTDTALVVAVSPNNTVAISAASLPLPTGAAAATTLTTLGSTTTKINDGTNTAAVKAASVAAIATDPALVVSVSPNNTVAVSAASLPLPTGAATASNLTTIGSQTTKINDGTNTAAVKPASTAPAATDPALVVSISPNSSITTTNPSVGATGATLPTSANLIGGINGANIIAVGVKPASTAAAATDQALVVAVSPNNTVAVSAATLPLPTGAATSANQTTLGSSTTKINDGTSTAAVKAASTAAAATDPALVVAISPNNTISVTSTNLTTIGSQTTKINDGTSTAAVKAASTAAAATDPALVVAISPNNTVPISAATLPLPTGAATAANLTTLGSQTTKINDGTNTVAIKAASTAPLATDPSMVVTISPNSPAITASNPSVGSTGSAFPTSATLMGGVNGANLATVAIKGASTAPVVGDNSLVVTLSPNSPSITASNASVGTSGSAAPTSSNLIGGINGANLVPVAIKGASTSPVVGDNSLVVTISPNSPAITASNPSVSATGAAIPAQATMIGGVNGANLVAATIKGASTAPIATDPSLVVTISPNSPAFSVASLNVGTTGSAVPTSANLIAGADGSGLLQSGQVLAVAPSSTTRGLVTRNIPSGTQNIAFADPGSIDTFGQVTIADRCPHIQIPFFQGAPSTLMTITTGAPGTATQSLGTAVFTTGSGGTITGTSFNTINYTAHNEIYVAMSIGFTVAPANGTQRVGLYDANNGFAFGYNISTFGIWSRYNAIDSFVAQNTWNVDNLSGGATSKFTSGGTPVALDQSKLNLYRIRFGWLGVANVIYEVLSPDGVFVIVHVLKYANTSTAVSVTTPNLPVTIEVVSAGALIVTTVGCITAGTTAPGQNPLITGKPTIAANGASVQFYVQDCTSAAISLSGTWVGTLVFQFSLDGTSWTTDSVWSNTTSTVISSATSNHDVDFAVGPYRYYRVLSTAWTSGTVTVLYNATSHDRQTNTIRTFPGNPAGSRTPVQIGYYAVATATADTLLSLVKTTNGVAAAGATTIPVTAGKTLRITAATFGIKAGAAAASFATFSLRVNPAGAAIITSQINARIDVGPTGATIGSAMSTSIPIADGFEMTGAFQLAISATAQATTNVLSVTLWGYEY